MKEINDEIMLTIPVRPEICPQLNLCGATVKLIWYSFGACLAYSQSPGRTRTRASDRGQSPNLQRNTTRQPWNRCVALLSTRFFLIISLYSSVILFSPYQTLFFSSQISGV
jgi:hypothetical protein